MILMSGDVFQPTEGDAKAMHKLRKMVSLSPKFQARSGQNFDYLWDRCLYRIGSSDNTLPFYVIDLNSGEDTVLADGDMMLMIPRGFLFLCIQVGPHPQYPRDNDRRLESVNFFSGIKRDLADLSGADDPTTEFGETHLGMTAINLIGIQETSPEHVNAKGLRYLGYYSIQWSNGDS